MRTENILNVQTPAFIRPGFLMTELIRQLGRVAVSGCDTDRGNLLRYAMKDNITGTDRLQEFPVRYWMPGGVSFGSPEIPAFSLLTEGLVLKDQEILQRITAGAGLGIKPDE